MPTEATITKHAKALLTYYIESYEAKYGKPPVMNRYKDIWGFKSLYEDIGADQGKAVIDYFFKTPRPGHTHQQLFQNYDRLNTIRLDQIEDEKVRLRLRKETEARVMEAERKRLGNNRG